MGIFAHILSYFEINLIQQHMEHWRLSFRHEGSFLRLMKGLLGFCVHSTTDNIAYDSSLHSQLAWNAVLKWFPTSCYVSIVGKVSAQASSAVLDSLRSLLFRDSSSKFDTIAGVDVSKW